MVIGSAVYAFSIILAVMLLGIVLGSFWASRFVDRSKNLLSYLVCVEWGIGLFVFLSVLLFNELPFLFLKAFEISGGHFGQLTLLLYCFPFHYTFSHKYTHR